MTHLPATPRAFVRPLGTSRYLCPKGSISMYIGAYAAVTTFLI